MCHSALTSSVCEAQSVTHSSVVPVLHFSTWPLCRKRAVKRRALKKKTLHDWRYGVTSTDQGGGKRRDGITTYGRKCTSKATTIMPISAPAIATITTSRMVNALAPPILLCLVDVRKNRVRKMSRRHGSGDYGIIGFA